MSERMSKLGLEPAASTPDEFEKFISNEIRVWAKVIMDVGIRPE
jgi:tripartite-type tricarboxylate transporter receptor subunit TctC